MEYVAYIFKNRNGVRGVLLRKFDEELHDKGYL